MKGNKMMKRHKHFQDRLVAIVNSSLVLGLMISSLYYPNSLRADEGQPEDPAPLIEDNSPVEETPDDLIVAEDMDKNDENSSENPPPSSDDNTSNNQPSTDGSNGPNPSTSPSAPDSSSTVPGIEPDLPKDQSLLIGDIRIRYEKNKIQVYKDQEASDLILTLQNYGRDVAENVVITPILDSSTDIWPFEIESNDYSVELKELKPISQVKPKEKYKNEEGEELPYGQVVIKGLKVREGVKAGYLPLRFNITYFNKKSGIKNEIKDRKFYIKHEVTEVPVETPSVDNGADFGGGGGAPMEEKTNTPRLILLSFETRAEKVQAGQEFTLKLNFQNTSKETLLQNIKMTLSSDESSFLPKSGSSTIFIDKVDPEAKVSAEIGLLPLATLAQKPYPISISLEFEDKDHTELKANETIAVPVYQTARTEISKLTVSAENTVGNESNVRFNILNKGKTTLYNSAIRFPENGPFGKYEEFVGNIEAGKQSELDLYLPLLRAPEPDEEVYFDLVFEDEFGEVTTVKQVIELKNVIDNSSDFGNEFGEDGITGSGKDQFNGSEPELSEDNLDAHNPDQGFRATFMNLPIWMKVILPILGIAAIAGVVSLAVKRHRRRKDLFDNEI